MYVAMRRMPDAVLVVENVITRRQVRGRAPMIDDRLHPLLLKVRVVSGIGIVRIIVRDRLISGFQYPVAGIGKPLPVIAGLRAVFGLGERRKFAAIRPELSHPVEHGNRDHWPGSAGLRCRNERVPPFTSEAARVWNAFEIPVLSAVVRV